MIASMTREQCEADCRRLVDAGDLSGAATLALRVYGPEIYGFLVTVMRSEDAAAEVFAETSLHLWRDLPTFRWECSLRTWSYTLAHHRMSAFRRKPTPSSVPLSLSPAREIAESVRTTTAVYLRTETKNALARLRERLEPDDQSLLILRVDRGLAWRDVARVMEAAEPALRKRFERLKGRLREMATEEGIVL